MNMHRAMSSRQKGMTLIEHQVAMALGLVVVLAAVAALLVARRGFTTVDAASQLRDSGRFASDVVQRIGVQAGYRDVFFATRQRKTAGNPAPNVMGFNNATLDTGNPLSASTARASGSVGFGSDILILRYQAAQLNTSSTDALEKFKADKTMIDCAGNPVDTVVDAADPTARDQRIASIFHVAINQGEPALMCTHSLDGVAFGAAVPLVQGVEDFQVLYGVDTVVPNAAPPVTLPAPNIPTAYLRADQMAVPGDAVATNANWRRVRSVKIGMVIRGATGSAQDSAAQTYYPFGAGKGSASGAEGSAFASSNDAGTIFSPAPDGRLRQSVSFTIHLRNDQGV